MINDNDIIRIDIRMLEYLHFEIHSYLNSQQVYKYILQKILYENFIKEKYFNIFIENIYIHIMIYFQNYL